MNKQEIFVIVSWILSILFSLCFITRSIIKRDRGNIKNGYYMLLVSITPFGAVIPLVLIVVGITALFVHIIPNWIEKDELT